MKKYCELVILDDVYVVIKDNTKSKKVNIINKISIFEFNESIEINTQNDRSLFFNLKALVPTIYKTSKETISFIESYYRTIDEHNNFNNETKYIFISKNQKPKSYIENKRYADEIYEVCKNNIEVIEDIRNKIKENFELFL